MNKAILEDGEYVIKHKGKTYKKGDLLKSYTNIIDEVDREYKKEISGKIYYITEDLVGLIYDNGIIESFQIPELFHVFNDMKEVKQIDYSLYAQNIVKECIEDLKNKNRGIVFNKEQLENVIKECKNPLNVKLDDGIYTLEYKEV